MDGRMDGKKNKKSGWVNRSWVDGSMGLSMGRLIDGPMDHWVDGSLGRLTEDRWIDRLLGRRIGLYHCRLDYAPLSTIPD
eukprot:9115206-Lingulodinium_polyedra.AAC.1